MRELDSGTRVADFLQRSEIVPQGLKSKVFIGSSKESLGWAEAIHAQLVSTTESMLWTLAFPVGEFTRDTLLDQANKVDYAVFVVDGVDQITTRRETRPAVRDNVLFEVGLFMGVLGATRTFILVPQEDCDKGLRLPSDLDGLTVGRYSKAHPSPRAAVHPICSDILRLIAQYGPRGKAGGALGTPTRTPRIAEYLAAPGDIAIVAHCDHSKWGNQGYLAPGATLKNNLVAALHRPDAGSPTLVPVAARKAAPRLQLSKYSTVFLVDSPQYNPFTLQVLDAIPRLMSGGVLGYWTTPSPKSAKTADAGTGSAVSAHPSPACWGLTVGAARYHSNKHPNYKDMLFGPYNDYLVVMRLPGELLGCGDEVRLLWIVYGLTTKGSHAGAELFSPQNISSFVSALQGLPEGVPEYFEAVLYVPDTPSVVHSFEQMSFRPHPETRSWDPKAGYCAPIRYRSGVFDGDPVPSDAASFFETGGTGGPATVASVHLDLTTDCNYSCTGCIESRFRQQRASLSFGRVARLLLDLNRLGCHDLRFYGGEPTRHPDFARVVQLADELGFEMLLVTNGSHLHEEPIADQLIRSRKKVRVRVSLDANSPQVHAKHHGCGTDEFPRIVASMKALIAQHVSVSVSYLLTTSSLAELPDACAFWRQAGAEAFLLRQPMNAHGTWPKPARSPEDESRLQQVLQEHGRWIVRPAWLEQWYFHGFPPDTVGSRRSDRCYSSYFRLVVSPLLETAAGDAVVVTDRAWLSMCPYFREQNDAWGCECPDDLVLWWKTRHASWLSAADQNFSRCHETVCSRLALHTRLQNELRASQVDSL